MCHRDSPSAASSHEEPIYRVYRAQIDLANSYSLPKLSRDALRDINQVAKTTIRLKGGVDFLNNIGTVMRDALVFHEYREKVAGLSPLGLAERFAKESNALRKELKDPKLLSDSLEEEATRAQNTILSAQKTLQEMAKLTGMRLPHFLLGDVSTHVALDLWDVSVRGYYLHSYRQSYGMSLARAASDVACLFEAIRTTVASQDDVDLVWSSILKDLMAHIEKTSSLTPNVVQRIAQAQADEMKFILLALQEDLVQKAGRQGALDSTMASLHMSISAGYNDYFLEAETVAWLRTSIYGLLTKLPASKRVTLPQWPKVLRMLVQDIDFELGLRFRMLTSGRWTYAFSLEELEAILGPLLAPREDDQFLEMFGNIPRLAAVSLVVGVKQYDWLDSQYTEEQDYLTTFLDDLRRFKVGKFERLAARVYQTATFPELIRRIATEYIKWAMRRRMDHFFRSHPGVRDLFPATVRTVSPKNALERCMNPLVLEGFEKVHFRPYVWVEGKRIDFRDAAFDKIVLDPPYGAETAVGGATNIEANKALSLWTLREASRLLRAGGRILLTLPPEISSKVNLKSKWNKHAELHWRKDHIELAAKELELALVSIYAEGYEPFTSGNLKEKLLKDMRTKRAIAVFTKLPLRIEG